MQLSKWEVWPWNWRKVRKAKISKEDRDLFERYGEAVIGRILAGEVPMVSELRHILPHSPLGQPEVLVDKFQEARNWLTECRDSQHRHDQRLETIEIGVVALITAEIVLSLLFGFFDLWEGWKQKVALDKQVTVLDQMKANTAETATAIQQATASLKTLADEQTKSLEILQQQEADRQVQAAKKPKPVLYAGHVSLARPHGPLKPSQETDTSTTFDFVLRNVGDANANKVTFRVLVPLDAGGVISNTTFFPILPASDLPDRPVRAFLLPVESLRAKNYVQFSLTFLFPKGHPPFQVMFNADAEEIRSDTPLGVLTVSPRTPPAAPKP